VICTTTDHTLTVRDEPHSIDPGPVAFIHSKINTRLLVTVGKGVDVEEPHNIWKVVYPL
jgi:hypothetical protein